MNKILSVLVSKLRHKSVEQNKRSENEPKPPKPGDPRKRYHNVY